MEKLQTKMTTIIENTIVEYGKIPSGLINGYESVDGIIYYIQTNDEDNHLKAVKQIIEQLEAQSYDHGSEWRETSSALMLCNEYCQISIVSFRVRDSY